MSKGANDVKVKVEGKRPLKSLKMLMDYWNVCLELEFWICKSFLNSYHKKNQEIIVVEGE